MKSKVSIITATYNSEKYITDTYNSLVNQSIKSWEWLVTDDCSTDSTLQILKSISKKDNRVKCFQNTINSGAAVSRNNSLNYISGDFVAFVDSDDVWTEDKLEKQIEFMGKDINFSFTGYRLMSDNGLLLSKTVDTEYSGVFNYNDMLKKKATIGCSTVMLRASILGTNRMPLLRTGQDYAFWLQLLKGQSEANLLPEELTRYRISDNSISRNKYKKAMRQWEIYRKVERLSIIKSAYCFCFYAFRAVFR